MVVVSSITIVFPMTAPQVKALIHDRGSCTLEDGDPLYDADGVPYPNGRVIWNGGVDHVITNDYNIESGMDLFITSGNYDPITNSGNKITFEQGASKITVQANGRLYTDANDNGFGTPKVAFMVPEGSMADWDGIYFLPFSEGGIADVFIKGSQNGIVFEPESKIMSPGIYDCWFEDIGNYGLTINGAFGSTNMWNVWFDDRETPSGTQLVITNAHFNVSWFSWFISHGPGKPMIRITNSKVLMNNVDFYGDFQEGPIIQIEGDSNESIFSYCLFNDGNVTEESKYYIQASGSTSLFVNSTFVTSRGAFTAMANNNETGVPAKIILRNPNLPNHGGHFDNTTINATGDSSVYLQWYLDVYVDDPNGNSIENAPVWVVDHLGNMAEPSGLTTNEDGWTSAFIVTELIQYHTTRLNLNPFEVSALNNSIIGYSNPNPIINTTTSANVTVPFNPKPNIPPFVSWITTPSGVQSGEITFEYMLWDSDSPDNGNLSVEIFYSTDSVNWMPTTAASGSDPTKWLFIDTLYTFIWDSKANFPDQNSTTVYLKIVPYDRAGPGTEGITGNFTVDNEGLELSEPTVEVSDTYAVIQWTVDEPANASVLWGPYQDGSHRDLIYETAGNILTKNQSVTLTGLTPGTNYTFTIESTDTMGNTESSYPTTYSFQTEIHIYLYEGWNLISLPPVLLDFKVKEVLEPIEGNYDVVQWYDASDSDDPWKTYNVGKDFGNDLTYIESEMGLWIHMLSDDMLIPNHKDPQTYPMWGGSTLELKKGWNLVGYPSVISRNVDNALSDVSYDLVQTYDAETEKWLEWDGSSGDLTLLEMGRGYWIHCYENDIWHVDYV
jgi:hypothetical protein